MTKIIQIVENFIKRKNLICYGGTAINNILPKEAQFYNKEYEIPDYDFFTTNSLNDAKELANIYYKEGFTDVEAKSGQHHGTYKVFVNYMPVADLTFVHKDIFFALKKEALRIAGILYAPPNFLRMAMYLELSRPAGDISRWEKVLKRLTILNKYYPLTNIDCTKIELQRSMKFQDENDVIYNSVTKTFIDQGVVFFGWFAISQYKKYMPHKYQQKVNKISDFDVLSNDPEVTAEIVKERLQDIGIKNVKINKKQPIGEIIPLHYEIKIGEDTIAFIYKPIGCHSYNIINIDGQKVKIATIDTMLSFYLAFLYGNKDYYNEFKDRILCISHFLYEVQQHNRLAQKGLLHRFSITCYGHQDSLEEIRAAKAEKYKELKDKRDTKEFEEWFLNYSPYVEFSKKNKEKGTTSKGTTSKRTTSKGTTSKGTTSKGSSSELKKTKTKRIKKKSIFNPYNKSKKTKLW